MATSRRGGYRMFAQSDRFAGDFDLRQVRKRIAQCSQRIACIERAQRAAVSTGLAAALAEVQRANNDALAALLVTEQELIGEVADYERRLEERERARRADAIVWTESESQESCSEEGCDMPAVWGYCSEHDPFAAEELAA